MNCIDEVGVIVFCVLLWCCYICSSCLIFWFSVLWFLSVCLSFVNLLLLFCLENFGGVRVERGVICGFEIWEWKYEKKVGGEK